jgi:hypothetical protein
MVCGEKLRDSLEHPPTDSFGVWSTGCFVEIDQYGIQKQRKHEQDEDLPAGFCLSLVEVSYNG